MTARQHQVLTFIHWFIAANGYSPSNQEIALAIGLKSTANIMGIVDRLLESGALVRKRGGGRGLALPHSDYQRGFEDGLAAARSGNHESDRDATAA